MYIINFNSRYLFLPIKNYSITPVFAIKRGIMNTFLFGIECTIFVLSFTVALSINLFYVIHKTLFIIIYSVLKCTQHV